METEVKPSAAGWRRYSEPATSSEQEAGQEGDLASAFGDQVARLRGAKRLSVAEASKRAGISRQHLWRIEKGIVRNVGRETVLRIAEALDVKDSALLDTEPSSQAQAILKVLWQHSCQLSSEDCKRLLEIEQNLLGILQDNGRI
jgi:transcriptional regulator with XRE-family HTH domain